MDDTQGKGGSYIIGEDGVRRLVERTEDPFESNGAGEQVPPAETNPGENAAE